MGSQLTSHHRAVLFYINSSVCLVWFELSLTVFIAKKFDSCRHKSTSWFVSSQGILSLFLQMDTFVWFVRECFHMWIFPAFGEVGMVLAGTFLFLPSLCIYYFRLVLQLLCCEQLCWWITNSLNCRFIAHKSSGCISARILGSILSSDCMFLEYIVLLMRHPGRLDFSICHAFMAKHCAACLVTI